MGACCGVEQEALESEAMPPPMNILLAEDNQENIKVAGAFLERMGLTYEVAGNGEDALSALSGSTYDAVLMDLEMPVMDGLEATRRLRRGEAGEKNRNIPVLAMTAHALHGYQQLSEEAGMNGYLSKPVSFRGLSEALLEVSGGEAAPAAEADAGERSRGILEKDEVLKNLGDNEDLLREIFEIFLRGAPERMDKLRLALDGDDPATARREVHSLKGNAATIGAFSLSALAMRAHSLIKSGEAGKAREMLPALEESLARVLDLLRRELDKDSV
jgi:CheY-like chemotaxis protein